MTQSVEESGWSSADGKLKVGGNNQGESLGKINKGGGRTYLNVCTAAKAFHTTRTMFAAETGSINKKKAAI